MARKSSKARKAAVLVLGMHRSGTSAVAGLLDKLGCQGPKTLLAKSRWNEKGYFESRVISELNTEILAAAGSDWKDWRPLSARWHGSPRFNEYRERAGKAIEAEYRDSTLIYLKDPRLSRLLPFWTGVLEDLGYKIFCIHVHRNPVDVAASLNRCDRMAQSISMLTWLRYVLDAESQSRRLPRIFVRYSDVLEDWTSVAGKIEKAFGFSLPALAQGSVRGIRTLIDPRLQHHNSAVGPFLKNRLAPDLVKDSLRIMEGWAAGRESASDHAALERVRVQFDLCAPLFSEPLQILEQTERSLPQPGAAHRTLDELPPEPDIGQRSDMISRGEVQDLRSRLTCEDAGPDRAIERGISASRLPADLTEGAQAGRDRHRELAERLRETEARLEELVRTSAAEIAALNAETDAATDRLIERDRVIAQLRSGQAESAKSERDKAQELAGKLRETEARLQELVKSSAAEVAALNAEVDAATDRVIERDRTIAQLRADHVAADDLHHLYRSSTSWRISAPVRRVGTLLRRVAGR